MNTQQWNEQHGDELLIRKIDPTDKDNMDEYIRLYEREEDAIAAINKHVPQKFHRYVRLTPIMWKDTHPRIMINLHIQEDTVTQIDFTWDCDPIFSHQGDFIYWDSLITSIAKAQKDMFASELH